MDMLRWILLLVGVAIIALVYFTGRRTRRDIVDEISSADPVVPMERNELRMEVKRRPPEVKDVDHELAQLSTLIAENRRSAVGPSLKTAPANIAARIERPTVGAVIDATTVSPSVRTEQSAVGAGLKPALVPETAAAKNAPPLEDKIIVLYVMAPPGGRFAGPDVRRAIEAAGLQYGQMSIFHRLVDPNRPNSDAVFSLANSVEPGTFDLDGLDDFSTPGLTLFMQLPGPLNGITALDSLLAAAHIIATELHGELRDQSRSVLSKQSIECLHSEIVEYQRLQRLARAVS